MLVPRPEWLEVANRYLENGGSILQTAAQLALPENQVQEILAKKECRDYLQEVYLDSGYRNRYKLAELLDRIIESKVREAEETEQFSNKDLADLIALAHKMRLEELKATQPQTQTNIQVNNYSRLMEQLLGSK